MQVVVAGSYDMLSFVKVSIVKLTDDISKRPEINKMITWDTDIFQNNDDRRKIQ